MKTIVVRYPLERDFVILRPDAYSLEDAFAEFNAGSCHECPEFVTGKIRSLSVGDLVCMDGQWHRCESVGWEKIAEFQMDAYLEKIRIRLAEQRAVENDPELPPWFAINDVVYNIKEVRKGGRFYIKA